MQLSQQPPHQQQQPQPQPQRQHIQQLTQQPRQLKEQQTPEKMFNGNTLLIHPQLKSSPQARMTVTHLKRTGIALPISVTTASHADPGRSLTREQILSSLKKQMQKQQEQHQQQKSKQQQQQIQLQQQQIRQPPTQQMNQIVEDRSQLQPDSLSKSLSQAQMQAQRLLLSLTKNNEAIKQLDFQGEQQSRSRSSITLAAGLAAPGSGITLPSGMNCSSQKKRKTDVNMLKHPFQVIKNENNSDIALNPLYSSACQASVTQQAALRSSNQVKHVQNPAEQLKITVVRSGNNPGTKYKYQKVVGGKPIIPKHLSMNVRISDLAPQLFLEKLLQSRGYSTQSFCSLEGGYYCKPTALQKASYGIRTVQAVRQSNPELLQKILDCKLSPNPCNSFGESVVHMACRRGDFKLLKILKDAGCSLQVTDDFGRTPLHDACWTAEPNFETVELILNTDIRLLNVVDCRGSSPLSYVKRDHWMKWIAYFQSRAERYWSPRDIKNVGEQPPPPLCNEKPHSRPIPDPMDAISLEVAQLIASGRMEPDDYLSSSKSVDESPMVDIHMSATSSPAPQVATIAS